MGIIWLRRLGFTVALDVGVYSIFVVCGAGEAGGEEAGDDWA